MGGQAMELVSIISANRHTSAAGPPVVLLPGMVAGAWMWGDTPQRLAACGYDAIVFSEAIGVLTHCIDDMTDIVELELDRLGISRMTIAGASLGSAVALRYAVRHPTRIAALVLSGAPAMTDQIFIESYGKLTRGVAELAVGRLFHDRSSLSEELLDRTFETFRDRRMLLNLVRLMRASKAFDSATPLEAVDARTLMIWGEHDHVSRVEDWRTILPRARRGTFVTIPQCGHVPMLERPAEFNHSLVSFLQAQTA